MKAKKHNILKSIVLPIMICLTILLSLFPLLSSFNKIGGASGSGSKLPAVGITLEDATWEQISAISSSGKARDYFNLGDEKTILLSTGENITVRIIGFNHDDLSDGSGKVGITFETKHCVSTLCSPSSSIFAFSNYKNSLFRTKTLPKIKSQLPKDLSLCIKQVKKNSVNGYENSSIDILDENLFLLAVTEIYLSPTGQSYCYEEGSVYEFYELNKDTAPLKLIDSDGDGIVDTSTSWWTRSRSLGNASAWYGISASPNNSGVPWSSFETGLSFAFCI